MAYFNLKLIPVGRFVYEHVKRRCLEGKSRVYIHKE